MLLGLSAWQPFQCSVLLPHTLKCEKMAARHLNLRADRRMGTAQLLGLNGPNSWTKPVKQFAKCLGRTTSINISLGNSNLPKFMMNFGLWTSLCPSLPFGDHQSPCIDIISHSLIGTIPPTPIYLLRTKSMMLGENWFHLRVSHRGKGALKAKGNEILPPHLL